MPRAPGAVGRAEPLRDDALTAELAGVLENDLAVALVGMSFTDPVQRRDPLARWPWPRPIS
jgi:hypothetical protein